MVPQLTVVWDRWVHQELGSRDEIVLPDLGVVTVVLPQISHVIGHQRCEARLLEIECRWCVSCQIYQEGQV